MAYSDFTLKRVKSELNIKIIENEELFPNIDGIEISQFLETMLKRNIPLALAINTEKARSELIIANILLEVKDQLKNEVSFFSGIDFTVDKDKGLNAYCDFILSRSIEQFYLETPVVTIVEAKNENITAGLGQCIAEMYGAAIFNERESNKIACIYGAVTIGDEWKFIKLLEDTAYIDTEKYYANDIQKIVAILVEMVKPK
ncbi:hypothetical protein THIOM_005516 [Candidatus Thiomargarita nelsonii]|uniref:Uncharacterized protein n=1 Tax=Candidatus Thiomargarita nelsonii TaxID=1003181 RepID=A0A176RT28_9GAMM|nr:hypothetical protein THIOM_005516 [Candidatus Thiomargarita nelsonii]